MDTDSSSPCAERGRLILLRGGGLGDVFVLGPALDALRRAHPALEVVGIGRRDALEVLADGGLLDRAHGFEADGFWRWFNAGVECDTAARDCLVGARYWISFGFGEPRPDLELGQLQLRRDCPAFPAGVEEPVWHYLYTVLRAAFPALPQPRADWYRSPVAADRGADRDSGGARVAIHPGSGAAAKNWPLENFLHIAGELRAHRLRPVFLLGEAEGGDLERAIRAAGFEILRRPLRGIRELLLEADAFLGNDSGITHLAAGLGLASVAVFGASEPRLWAPLGPRAISLGGSEGWPGRREVRSALFDALEGAYRSRNTEIKGRKREEP